MDEQNLGILERIHASYYHLTAAERKVADYVISNYDHVQFMSITQLAEECGTAEATISRFCRGLQLKGFNAFKIELAKHSVAAKHTHTEKDPSTPQGRWAQAAGSTIDAIHQTVSLAEPRQVSKAVKIFENAPRVMCIGSGNIVLNVFQVR